MFDVIIDNEENRFIVMSYLKDNNVQYLYEDNIIYIDIDFIDDFDLNNYFIMFDAKIIMI